jgi:hypothetical protein
MGAFLESRAERDRLLQSVVRVSERCADAPVERLKLIEMLGPALCVLVHDKDDLNREDIGNAKVILHGRSAAAAVVRIGPRAFITPGSVQGRGTVAVLEVSGALLGVQFFDLAGQLIRAESVSLAMGTHFAAR